MRRVSIPLGSGHCGLRDLEGRSEATCRSVGSSQPMRGLGRQRTLKKKKKKKVTQKLDWGYSPPSVPEYPQSW